jgi:predicted negative regulator of RcsB-dependent stress response
VNASAFYWVLQAGVEVAMAEEYLTDDEQLEAVKRAFTEYAPWILGGVVLGVGGWFGIQYYRSHQNDAGNARLRSNSRK